MIKLAVEAYEVDPNKQPSLSQFHGHQIIWAMS